MLLASAMLIAIAIALVAVSEGRRNRLDWHSQRGLSFLQLGLREIKRLFRILYAGFAGLNEFSELSALSHSPKMFAINICIQDTIEPIKRLCYQHLPIPRLATLPQKSPPPAAVSLKKRAQLETRIEFSRVTVFSS